MIDMPEVGKRYRATYRVAPFLTDDILTVTEVSNVGTKKKPCWRALCVVEPERIRRGWLDGDNLEAVTS